MLDSVEHEIVNAHKDKNIEKLCFFLGSGKPRMLFFPLRHIKMPTIVGILTFMSRKNFMLNCVEHEKSFITSGPAFDISNTDISKYLLISKTIFRYYFLLVFEPVSVKTGLNDIDIKIEVTTSLERIGFSIHFRYLLRSYGL